MSENDRKEIAEEFLTKCTPLGVTEKYIDYAISQIQSYANLNEEELNIVKEKFNINSYKEDIYEVILQIFSDDDLKNCISFYSTDSGKKMIGSAFTDLLSVKADGFFRKVSNEFESIVNNRQKS